MGTRSVVAVPTEDGGWRGRYIHFDGYPEWVGETIASLVDRDGLAKVVQVLVQEHYGWSSLDANQMDKSQMHGQSVSVSGYGVAYTDQAEDTWITSDGPGSGCEWAYVLTSDGIQVWERYSDAWEPRDDISERLSAMSR